MMNGHMGSYWVGNRSFNCNPYSMLKLGIFYIIQTNKKDNRKDPYKY